MKSIIFYWLMGCFHPVLLSTWKTIGWQIKKRLNCLGHSHLPMVKAQIFYESNWNQAVDKDCTSQNASIVTGPIILWTWKYVSCYRLLTMQRALFLVQRLPLNVRFVSPAKNWLTLPHLSFHNPHRKFWTSRLKLSLLVGNTWHRL